MLRADRSVPKFPFRLPSCAFCSKLAIFGFDYSRRPSACEYYRVYTPLNQLVQQGKGFVHINKGEGDHGMLVKAMLHSDIVQMYALSTDMMGDNLQTINNMKVTIDDQGGMHVPPSTVFDIDDNNDYVHPHSPSYEYLGYRTYPEGKIMEPGDNITMLLADGTEHVMWDDQVTYGPRGGLFDIARNRRTVADQMSLARMAHGVTVPSVALAKYFKNVQKCKNVHVFPNTIVLKDWFFPNLAPRTDGKIRVLWQGGDSHLPDWYPLKDAMAEICHRYPQVEVVIWGAASKWIVDAIPEGQLVLQPWIGFDGYRPIRGMIDCDINLAPLTPSKFNACKSAIKWYEASLGPRPEATLASNTAPYSLEMVDGETGLLYNTPEEFVQKLGVLVENETLRKQLAQNAQKWVLANRTPEVTIPPLHDFYQELRAQRRQEYYAK